MRRNVPILIAIFFAVALLLPFRFSHALTFTPQRFETEADPGQVIEREMTLINEGTDPQTFYSVTRNFEAEGETGVPTPTNSDTGLASWIKTQKQITLAPKSSETVAFQIYVPKDTEPGGYFAMLLWSTSAPQVQGGQVAVSAQTGPLILLSVKGAVKEAGVLNSFSVKNNQKFFLSLPVNFMFKFRNDGGDRVKPQGTIKIRNILGLGGATIQANTVEGNVLPSGTRLFQTEWKRSGIHASATAKAPDPKTLGFFENVRNQWYNFAFGRYTATLAIDYGTKGGHASAETVFWVVPWQLLVTAIILILILYFMFKGMIRRYNKFIIGQATIALEKIEDAKAKNNSVQANAEEKSESKEEGSDTVDLRRRHRRKV